MARIKAKPMNRLPISSVPSAVVNMKNGYRTPPGTATPVGAPAPAASAVYEPAPSYQPPPPPPPHTSHQRFLYTNSSTLPPAINYANQLQIYVSVLHKYLHFFYHRLSPSPPPVEYSLVVRRPASVKLEFYDRRWCFLLCFFVFFSPVYGATGVPATTFLSS